MSSLAHSTSASPRGSFGSTARSRPTASSDPALHSNRTPHSPTRASTLHHHGGSAMSDSDQDADADEGTVNVPDTPSDRGSLSATDSSPPGSPHFFLPSARLPELAGGDVVSRGGAHGGQDATLRPISVSSLGLSRTSTASGGRDDNSSGSGRTIHPGQRSSADTNRSRELVNQQQQQAERPPAPKRQSTLAFSPVIHTHPLSLSPDHPHDPERGSVYGFMSSPSGSPELALRQLRTRTDDGYMMGGDLAEQEIDGDATSISEVGLTTGAPVRSRDEYLGGKLRKGLMSEEKLTELRLRKGKGGKRLLDFHREQNEHIENLLAPISHHVATDASTTNAVRVKIAIYASMICNFFLSILQLYAAISSLSLSLIATCIDSVFDVWSNLLLWGLHRKAVKIDLTRFPAGGARLETIGNVVYGFFMGAVNLVIIVESVRTILSHEGEDTNKFHLAALLAVGAALIVKICLFIYCYFLRSSSSQVAMLWEDHRNDIFVNSFGVIMSAGGAKLRWWLDPMGAVIIAAGVCLSWTRTVKGEFELLAGKSAPREFLQLVTYKALTFSEEIDCIDSVKAYHSGPNYIVEVDIVLPASMPLSQAHDVGQSLQDQLEELPSVERAYVHLDFETSHKPEHAKSK